MGRIGGTSAGSSQGLVGEQGGPRLEDSSSPPLNWRIRGSLSTLLGTYSIRVLEDTSTRTSVASSLTDIWILRVTYHPPIASCRMEVAVVSHPTVVYASAHPKDTFPGVPVRQHVCRFGCSEGHIARWLYKLGHAKGSVGGFGLVHGGDMAYASFPSRRYHPTVVGS